MSHTCSWYGTSCADTVATARLARRRGSGEEGGKSKPLGVRREGECALLPDRPCDLDRLEVDRGAEGLSPDLRGPGDAWGVNPLTGEVRGSRTAARPRRVGDDARMGTEGEEVGRLCSRGPGVMAGTAVGVALGRNRGRLPALGDDMAGGRPDRNGTSRLIDKPTRDQDGPHRVTLPCVLCVRLPCWRAPPPPSARLHLSPPAPWGPWAGLRQVCARRRAPLALFWGCRMHFPFGARVAPRSAGHQITGAIADAVRIMFASVRGWGRRAWPRAVF